MEDHEKVLLWNHILVQAYGTSDLTDRKNLPADPEGHAFFEAIDSAFCATDTYVAVHHELVQYIAGWGRDMSQGYDQRGGPFGPKHNHFVRRAFSAFIETLRVAIKTGKLRYHDPERIMFGCFVVPKWLIDKYMDEAHREAINRNKLWDEQPSMRQYMRNDSQVNP